MPIPARTLLKRFMKFSLVMALSSRSRDRAVDGGGGEHLLQLVVVGLEGALDRLDLVQVCLARGRPQADGLECLLHLAVRERIAGGQLVAERCGTLAGARQAG